MNTVAAAGAVEPTSQGRADDSLATLAAALLTLSSADRLRLAALLMKAEGPRGDTK